MFKFLVVILLAMLVFPVLVPIFLGGAAISLATMPAWLPALGYIVGFYLVAKIVFVIINRGK